MNLLGEKPMKLHGLRLIFVILTIFVISPVALWGQTQPSPTMPEAEAFFQANQWNEAIQAFEAITKANPGNGLAWFRLGMAFHSAGKYDQAIPALQKAVEILKGPMVMFRLGCTFARKNEPDKAWEWLDKAAQAGFNQPQLVQSSQELASLQKEDRYKEFLSKVKANSRPCLHKPEYKQFDFWLGQWSVMQGDQETATNIIQRQVESCIILENYTQSDGYNGKSVNFFDSSLGKWRQTWVDCLGNVGEFIGQFKDGAMQFEGETHQANGTKVLRRLTFYNLGPDKVRQYSEASTDGGKTWNPHYDITYIRKKNP